MKQIKSIWRSRLATPRLSDLMCIQLESNAIDSFDPTVACQLWANDQQRKPSYVRQHSKHAPRSENSSDSEGSNASGEECLESESDGGVVCDIEID